MGIPDNLTYRLRNLYAGQEATVRTGHGTKDCSKSGKEDIKAVYCHCAYLTYMQSTSWETLGRMKHKLESRLLGEISITRYTDDTTLMAESKEELKSLLMKVKEDSVKAGLKLKTQLSPRGCRELDTTERLNKTTILASLVFCSSVQCPWEGYLFWGCFLVSFLTWVIRGQDLRQCPIDEGAAVKTENMV